MRTIHITLAVTGVAAAVAMATAGLIVSQGAADEPAIVAGSPSAAAETTPPAEPAPAPDVEADPYEQWLQRAPADAPELTRDDAFARAYLGCGQTFPPGTTDAILAEVYADHLDCR